MVTAETYNFPQLKSKRIDFFAMEAAEFTEGFVMLLQECPALAAELRGRVGI